MGRVFKLCIPQGDSGSVVADDLEPLAIKRSRARDMVRLEHLIQIENGRDLQCRYVE